MPIRDRASSARASVDGVVRTITLKTPAIATASTPMIVTTISTSMSVNPSRPLRR
jgi:hypothetical protein